MELECPYCKKTMENVDEYLPSNACDDALHECEHCEAEMKIGWYAEPEIRQTFSDVDYEHTY